MTDRYTVERIMEIISFVIDELRHDTPLQAVDVSELHRRGYTESEISAALSWIMERQGTRIVDTEIDRPDSGSFRVLHDIEQDLIAPEAWGLVLTYRDLGFLTGEDVENILERAIVMGADGGVSEIDVRNLIAAYVMHQHPLPQNGSRSLLNGSETIN